MFEEFKGRELRFIDEDYFSKYSVIVPFVKKEDGWYLLYQKRAKDLKIGAGEICFPGGKIEKGESPFEAGLRELEEELLLSKEKFDFWGSGDILLSHANHMIYPFLGELKEMPIQWNKDEVEKLMLVPVCELKEPSLETFSYTSTTVPENFPYHLVRKGKNYPWMKRKVNMPFFETSQCVIWGMTARITKNVIGLINEYHLIEL